MVIAVSLVLLLALLVAKWRGTSDLTLSFFAAAAFIAELSLMASAYGREGVGTQLVLHGLLAAYFVFVAVRYFYRSRNDARTGEFPEEPR